MFTQSYQLQLLLFGDFDLTSVTSLSELTFWVTALIIFIFLCRKPSRCLLSTTSGLSRCSTTHTLSTLTGIHTHTHTHTAPTARQHQWCLTLVFSSLLTRNEQSLSLLNALTFLLALWRTLLVWFHIEFICYFLVTFSHFLIKTHFSSGIVVNFHCLLNTLHISPCISSVFSCTDNHQLIWMLQKIFLLFDSVMT